MPSTAPFRPGKMGSLCLLRAEVSAFPSPLYDMDLPNIICGWSLFLLPSVTRLAEMKYSKKTLVLCSSIWLIEIFKLKKTKNKNKNNTNFLRSLTLRNGKELSQREKLSPGKTFHTVLITCQTTLHHETEAQSMIDQRWTWTTPGPDIVKCA